MNSKLPWTVLVRRMLQVLIWLVIQMAVLFGAAGSLNWPMAWIYLGLSVAMIAVNSTVLYHKNPDLITERSRLNEKTKGWDMVVAPLIAIVGPLAMLTVAGLDRRFGWTPAISPVVLWIGAIFVALGMVFMGWAMVANRFFACTVAIQDSRGHSVISSGPYGIVRHPGYTAMAFISLATPFMFGSLWALLPVAFTIIALVVRTYLEDNTLQAELQGYEEYTQTVRFRLFPGLW